MRKNKTPITILLFLLLNLLVSAGLAHAGVISSGSISISECLADCLSLSVPPQLSIEANAVQFISNQAKHIYFYSNYNEFESGKIHISNAYEKGFNLSVITTPSVNSVNNIIQIPYAQIGIASFNNGITELNGSIDASRIATNLPIESQIDPVYRTRGDTVPILEPFDQTTLQDLIHINSPALPNYYVLFDGENANSNSINIIESSPDDSNSMGSFNLGLSLMMQMPTDSINAGLIEGTYNSTLTFTLTSNP